MTAASNIVRLLKRQTMRNTQYWTYTCCCYSVWISVDHKWWQWYISCSIMNWNLSNLSIKHGERWILKVERRQETKSLLVAMIPRETEKFSASISSESTTENLKLLSPFLILLIENWKSECKNWESIVNSQAKTKSVKIKLAKTNQELRQQLVIYPSRFGWMVPQLQHKIFFFCPTL